MAFLAHSLHKLERLLCTRWHSIPAGMLPHTILVVEDCCVSFRITRFAGADPDGDDTHVRDLALEVVGVGISSPRPLLPHPVDPPLGDVSSSAHGRGIAVRLVSDGSRSGRSREDGAADSDTAVSAATAPSQQSRHHTLRYTNRTSAQKALLVASLLVGSLV